MITALLLALLAQPSTTPSEISTRVSFQHAGFVHDVHVALPERDRLTFHGRIDWPVAATRRTFVVEAFDDHGNLILSRTTEACVEPGRARHKRARLAEFTLSDAGFARAAEIRVRVAN